MSKRTYWVKFLTTKGKRKELAIIARGKLDAFTKLSQCFSKLPEDYPLNNAWGAIIENGVVIGVAVYGSYYTLDAQKKFPINLHKKQRRVCKNPTVKTSYL